MNDISIGDYVLATKYADGDPGDHWALGFYAGPLEGTDKGLFVRHMVVDREGRNFRGNGFRRVGRIREDVGRWLLTVAAKQLEASPFGTVNLWAMFTPAAFDLRGGLEE